jgi:hypothetical protein
MHRVPQPSSEVGRAEAKKAGESQGFGSEKAWHIFCLIQINL